VARAFLRSGFNVVAGLLVGSAALAQGVSAPTHADVAPLLTQRCVVCHSGDSAAAGLRLDSLEALLKGSARGAVIKPGDASNSELIRRVKGISLPRMPMTGPPFLTQEEVALLESWVNGGAPKGVAGPPASPPLVAPIAPENVTWVQVAPLLARRCAKCHTDNGQMGAPPEGYRLTSHASTIDSSDRARVVPGRPEASELIRRIRGQARPRMPFDGPPYLNEDEIRLLENWVSQGARNAEGKKTPWPVGANVRLHGSLVAGPAWQFEDLALSVTSSTRVDKRPGPGSYVEVRGRLMSDGQILVDRMRGR
jgi:Planctomycete cytochrome C